MNVTDFHSHILPSLDHGCANVGECRTQLELMHENGTSLAVATPHFYPHMHKSDIFYKNSELAVSQIKSANITNAPELCLGAEVLLCDGLENMKNLPLLCIRGTQVILLELPTHSLKNSNYDTVDTILSRGYTVVLAHIDRYLKKNQEDIDNLLSMGALAQINAEALFSRSSMRKINKYLEQTDKICALGSDLHGAEPSRYADFAKAHKVLKDYYDVIMSRTETLLLGAERFKLA